MKCMQEPEISESTKITASPDIETRLEDKILGAKKKFSASFA